MDFTLKQLSELTGRPRSSLYRLVRRGRIPGAYRLGGRWHVAKEVFEELRAGKDRGTK